jgi:predicted small secreted protein
VYKLPDKIERIKGENVGKWIAVKDDKPVAVSVDFNEVVKKTKDIKGVYIFYSPTPEEKKYGYLFVFVVK